MPVRKIPKNYLGVTGGYSSSKNEVMNGFESLLEKDYMLLLDFDDSVDGFEEQPVNVPVEGIAKGYTPDVLVRYTLNEKTGDRRCPLLVDIKHAEEAAKNAEKYAPKFSAARLYAAERGWEFKVVMHHEIRTPRLANIKFLREYRNVEPAEQDLAKFVSLVAAAGGRASTQALLTQLAVTDDDRLHWWPVIWHALFIKNLACDLDTPFDDDVMLHLPGSA